MSTSPIEYYDEFVASLKTAMGVQYEHKHQEGSMMELDEVIETARKHVTT